MSSVPIEQYKDYAVKRITELEKHLDVAAKALEQCDQALDRCNDMLRACMQDYWQRNQLDRADEIADLLGVKRPSDHEREDV